MSPLAIVLTLLWTAIVASSSLPSSQSGTDQDSKQSASFGEAYVIDPGGGRKRGLFASDDLDTTLGQLGYSALAGLKELGSSGLGLGSLGSGHGDIDGLALKALANKGLLYKNFGTSDGLVNSFLEQAGYKALSSLSGLKGSLLRQGGLKFGGNLGAGLNDLSGDDFSEGQGHSPVVTKQVAVPVPQPYPVPVLKKVPVPVPKPIPVPVEKPYPYPVHVPVKVPVPVIRPVPFPVHVPIRIPIKLPYPVEVPKPYPVEVPVKIPVPHRVPVHVPKPVPYPVEVPVKIPVPQPYAVHVPVRVREPSYPPQSYNIHEPATEHENNAQNIAEYFKNQFTSPGTNNYGEENPQYNHHNQYPNYDGDEEREYYQPNHSQYRDTIDENKIREHYGSYGDQKIREKMKHIYRTLAKFYNKQSKGQFRSKTNQGYNRYPPRKYKKKIPNQNYYQDYPEYPNYDDNRGYAGTYRATYGNKSKKIKRIKKRQKKSKMTMENNIAAGGVPWTRRNVDVCVS